MAQRTGADQNEIESKGKPGPGPGHEKQEVDDVVLCYTRSTVEVKISTSSDNQEESGSSDSWEAFYTDSLPDGPASQRLPVKSFSQLVQMLQSKSSVPVKDQKVQDKLTESDKKKIIKLGDTEFFGKLLVQITREEAQKMLFGYNIFHQDSRTLRLLVEHPMFDQLIGKESLIRVCQKWITEVKLSGSLMEVITYALLPRLTSENRHQLTHLLKIAMSLRCSSSILHCLDKLWFSSCEQTPNTIHINELQHLYTDLIISEQFHIQVDESVVLRKVVALAIKRHVELYLDVPGSSTTKIAMSDAAFRYNLLEFATSSNYSNEEIRNLLPEINEREIDCFRKSSSDLNFISSEFQKNDTDFIQPDEEVLQEIIPEMLSKMQTLSTSQEVLDIQLAIKDFISEIAKEMSVFLPDYTFKPLLVGSSAESTRCYFDNEYDFLLVFSLGKIQAGTEEDIGTHIFQRIRQLLLTVVPKLLTKKRHRLSKDQRLVLEDAFVFATSRYPCVHVIWTGDVYKFMRITIDLVPACEPIEPVSLPAHSYLSQECLEKLKADCSYQHGYIHNQHEYNLSIIYDRYQTQQESKAHSLQSHYPSLYMSIPVEDDVDYAYSEVENFVINALPPYIREAYKISKAIRLSKLMQPVLPFLLHLGVSHDIKDIVRSYYLKTSVFYITEKHSADVDNEHDCWVWAMRIYDKLREYLLIGVIPVYFQTDIQFQCDHDREEYQKHR